MSAVREWFTISSDGATAALDPDATTAVPPGLVALLEQETGRHRRSVPNGRVAELAELFGFGFEPWAEPGHIRMLPMAANMHAAAEAHARQRFAGLAAELGLPLDEVVGVLLVDTTKSALSGYLDLIHADSSLYGAEPYALAGSRGHLILRQTSCLGKYSVASMWDWESTPVPRCLLEISDSFRGELDEDLEQLFRVRRFRLPEAHIHHADFASAMDASRAVNQHLSRAMRELGTEFVLLVSVSYRTWVNHQEAIATMVADSRSWALVIVTPPGELCQDGIELDFEYKFLDADDVPRELATFQLDTQITRSVGLTKRGGELTTMHVVPTGSVERLVYAHLDRVARLELDGARGLLPPWLTPVAARLMDDPALPKPAITALADEALRRGLCVEIDDRPMSIEAKLADADRYLIPYAVFSNPDGHPGRMLVREYIEGRVSEQAHDQWLVPDRRPRTAGPLGSSTRLSLRPATRLEPPRHHSRGAEDGPSSSR